MKKLLITGGSGLLGANLALACCEEYETYVTYLSNRIEIPGCAGSVQVNLSDADAVSALFSAVSPDVVIHTAALTNVDRCETERMLAYESNVVATEFIARECKKAGARLIHISTDYVFDGSGSDYKETDMPNPLSYYAQTKLDGESLVCGICSDYCIVRTTIYGWNAQDKVSFVDWILRRIESGHTVPLFIDQFYSPILVNNLSQALKELAGIDYTGILHCAGAQRCSRLELGQAVAEVFGMDSSLITPVTMTDLSFPAERPSDSSLDITLAKNILKTEFLSLKDNLRWMKELKEQGYAQSIRSYMKVQSNNV